MKKKPFSDQLRAAVLDADVTRYRISKDTGISESILSRFCRGDAGLSMEYVDRLCERLDLRLIGPESSKPRMGGRKSGSKSKGK